MASAALNILSLGVPIAILQIYDRVVPYQATATLAVFVIALGVVAVMDLLLSLARAYVSGWGAARMHHKLACGMLGRMLSADLRAFTANPPGVHLNRLRGVDAIKGFYGGQGILLLVDLPFAFVFLGLIYIIAGPLILAPLLIIVLLASVASAVGQRLSDSLKYRVEADNRRYNFMIEVLQAIHTVKALGMEALMVRRYERLQTTSAAANYHVSETSAATRNVGLTFSQLTTIAVGTYGSTLVMDGMLSIGGLAACTLLAGRVAQPMLRALSIWTQFQSFKFGREQIKAIESLPQEPKGDVLPDEDAAPAVELADVRFSYREDLPELFDGLSLKVEAGETIGVAGGNGSGKSTLLGLMMGALSPTAGSLRIAGHDIATLDPTAFRRQVCYLPQKSVMFEGTILDNLTLFRGNRYAAKAMHFADRLALHEVIGQMPQGYSTVIENGRSSRIPSGVRQRIALVRALTLADDIRLLLFDEAYSNLDRESDDALLSLIDELRAGATTVIVSHRPSYLGLADRTFMLQNQLLVPGGGGARQQIARLKQEMAS
ncbi:MAG: ABC transporter transmembrane domain-containing protein [Alphaproteobacteria bacterium]